LRIDGDSVCEREGPRIVNVGDHSAVSAEALVEAAVRVALYRSR
jgi:hypothetical protein